MKRKMAKMMAAILCMASVLQPLSAYADEVPGSTTVEEIVTGETVAESEESVLQSEPESAPETEAEGTDTMQETDAGQETDAASETETEDTPAEPVRYTVSGIYEGDGKLTLTDDLGNVYEIPAPGEPKEAAVDENSQVTLRAEAGKESRIASVEIKDGLGKVEKIEDMDVLNAYGCYEKTITVSSNLKIKVNFQEISEETEMESETITEIETESETEPETENGVVKGKYEGVAKDGEKRKVAEGYIAENEEEMDAILHPEISLFSYEGQTLYVSAGSYTSVYDNGFTNRYDVVGDGDTTHYAYCLQPDAPDPSGDATVYEVDNFNIKLVLCLAMYGPAEQYGFYAGIWPGLNEYNAGAYLPAAFGYVHATLGYLYGAGPGIGLSEANAAQIDSWVQACIDVYNSNPEVKRIVDNAKLFYLYGGYDQDVAWVEYTPPQNGWIELQKSSADPEITTGNSCYSLAGAVYGVYDASGGEVARLVTDANGYAKSEELPEGDYTIREITAPQGFYIDTTSHSVTVTAEQTATVNVTDNPKMDPVGILLGKIDAVTNSNKPSGSKNLEGALFEVKFYNVPMDTDPAKSGYSPERSWILKTNVDGFCGLSNTFKASGDDFYYSLTGNPSLPVGTVTIQEIQAPEGYLVNNEVFVRKIEPGDTAAVSTYNAPTIPETPQMVQIKLKKTDSETGKGEAQGAGTLAGATYVIRDPDNNVVDTLITDESGCAISKELPLGDYTVVETESSNGYLVDRTTYTVEASVPKNSEDHVFEYEVTSGEDIIRGDVEIVKFVEDPDEDNETLEGLEGVEFTFTSKTTGAVVKKIVTDKNGFATTASAGQRRGSLVFDTYVVTETKHPTNVKPVEPFEVTISEEGVTLKGIYKENKLIVSPVTVVKKDATTGNIIPLAGVEFRLLDADKNPVTMTTRYPETVTYETFKTNDKGQFTFPSKLVYGNYYLEEVNAPEGYLKGELLEFSVTEGAGWENPLIVEYADEPAMGKIRIEKTDAETKEPLSGAEFDVIAAEDIVTPDGTVRLNKGDVADHVVTKGGAAESKELYLGNYEIVETKQPQGYVLNGGSCSVTLEYKDQMTNVVTQTIDVTNKPTRARIIKIDSKSGEALPGVEFKIWNKAMADDDVDAGMATDMIYTTDENGTIEIGYLSPGSYCVQETKSIYGYMLDDTIYEFTVSEDGLINGKEIGEITITNTPVEFGTKAADGIDGDKNIVSDEDMTIIDTVSYTGLIPGREYTVSGVLMDKATGKPLEIDGKQVTAETTFVPDAEEGTVDVTYTFDASALAGKTIVVFEKLLYEGKEVAAHEDINDVDQSVDVVPPSIHTTAVNKADGKKVIVAGGNVTIVDTVSYTNLIPGREYTLKGVLMDKATGKALKVKGKEVTSELTFTPESADGAVKVEFAFDASAVGNAKLVVFEKLYNANGKVIAAHEDITDEGQTVEFVAPSVPETPKTGDTSLPYAAAGLLMMSLLVMGMSFRCRRKKADIDD